MAHTVPATWLKHFFQNVKYFECSHNNSMLEEDNRTDDEIKNEHLNKASVFF